MKQHTLQSPFSFESKGLHTGLYIHATFLPAEENTGIRICRTDLEGRPTYEAIADYVTATERGTVISRINPVPAVFAPSPLLSVAGGEIPVRSVPGKPGEFTPEHTMFKVEITPDKPVVQQQGRTLRVLVSNREILFDKFVSSVIYFFRSEF